MNWGLRIGGVLGAIGALSVAGVFESSGFGPCAGTLRGAVFLLTVVTCVPAAALFFVIGTLIELRPKRVVPPGH
jgi:hypothetical protein